MKHISEIIALRKHQLEQQRDRQLTLFVAPQEERGSREWRLFTPIAHDRVEGYPVTAPRKREELRYPNIVPIRRYPRHLAIRFAR
ncbi:hypothetical protein COU18_00420 [Candidatus Kaiserbacteria bacterium CG10_big_fil_rev_8_21_14_0_10_51_14]|uniref:Uncharacterized protein n=1 Tax=Candidatus Kaiserbacteria bacterium CG10_big_fil_rev_8_21_14_0_10_51_14 TaxID=1974610 RepID=A0A2H0UEJ7_9BACT|nr:MAG: hypothetical protein COU18_00420 [Candidatus Kaiserbacteria bacterium CG10_big_fil_rev_8_21_14_0_10_51_14]